MRLDATSLTGLSPDRIRRAGLALVPEGHRVLGKFGKYFIGSFESLPTGGRRSIEGSNENVVFHRQLAQH
ncbi:hypothetical protein ACCS66_38395, partial [Rhizobium ruizarguesonis]